MIYDIPPDATHYIEYIGTKTYHKNINGFWYTWNGVSWEYTHPSWWSLLEEI